MVLQVLTYSYSQNEYSNWLFGQSSWLYFGEDSLELEPGSAMYAHEGCASISDGTGTLLFYTNGEEIYDASHSVMVNGDYLLGDMSSVNSSLIVKKPGSNNLYYVFFTSDEGNYGGFNYSVVDMSLNNGLGEVIHKNIIVYQSCAEKLTAVIHSNQHDIWILTHELNGKKFRSYLLTDSGLDSVWVSSSVGKNISPWPSNLHAIGCLKSNRQGDKIAMSNYADKSVEIFDFDASTGQVSNEIEIAYVYNVHFNIYGLEFSPSGDYLYCSVGNYTAGLYQFDISSGDETQIRASIIDLGSYPGTTYQSIEKGGALQLAPDGRIYYSVRYAMKLAVIEEPNKAGGACGFHYDHFLLNDRAMFGLPNIPSSFIKFDSQNDSLESSLVGRLLMPNIFSPNEDGDNDLFKPVEIENISSLEVVVYNRYGVELFISKELDFSWDGNFKGKSLSEGIYFVCLKYVDSAGKSFSESGTLRLVR